MKSGRIVLTALVLAWSWSQPAKSGAEVPGGGLPDVKELPVQTRMPDPLVDAQGNPITSAQAWKVRRQEMKRILEYYALGQPPPPPRAVTGEILQSQSLRQGTVDFRRVHLSFGPGRKLGFDVALFIPALRTNLPVRLATIIHPSFSRTPGTPPPRPGGATPELTPGEPGWVRPEVAVEEYAEPLRRGYAILTFYYQQCGLDRKNDYRQSGFFPAYPEYDWGDLAAWAWGMSRCVDYLETQSFADPAQMIAVGHSRLGKAALVAGAWDERFALTAPAGSGCAGTGAYRFNGKSRGGKEGLEEATRRFPQWFGPRLSTFAGQVERLPFDQHWLMALIAPRLILAADALDDPYANGNALAQSYLAAAPVFAWLGVPDHLGIHFRPGGHLLAPADWEAILDFSDHYLRQVPARRRFDQIPAGDQLH